MVATINDVAKLANVSKSTVSNVFSKKKYISPELTEKVLAAAKELNFQTNYFARTLATKTSKIIGISFEANEKFNSQFQLNIIKGILSICAKQGYYLLIEPTGKGRDDYLPMDGMIKLNPATDEQVSDTVPHVWVGLPPEKELGQVCFVDNDNQLISQELTSMMSRKHRRIVYLNTYENNTVAPERYKGYLKEIKEKNLDNLHFYTPKDALLEDFAYHKAKELLLLDNPVDAFILDSDLMALAIYKLASELDLQIPEDFSVAVFYSSINANNIFKPELTSVDLNEYELGKTAAQLLIQQLQSNELIIPNCINISGSIKVTSSVKI